VTTLILACGLLFELPVVLVILARLGIVTPEWLRQQRPYAILVLVIAAALVTPTTDPINLLLMAVPLVLLYELSIQLARWTTPRAKPDNSGGPS
jgi:sec-independent protein translocase protein TatC